MQWARQQTIKRRVKRDFVEVRDRRSDRRSDRAGRPSTRPRLSRSKTPVMFSDPRWPQMWYLVSE